MAHRNLAGARALRLGSAVLGLLLAGPAPKASAAPALTGPEARAFLGGRTGKLVYLKNNLKQIHFVDFADSALVERKVADDAYCWSPMIHPDGSRIVYETGASIYIRSLEENSKERFLVYAGVPKGNHSLEPHWWIHPATKDEYIIFTTGDVSDLEWPPKSGATYMQKVVGNKPSGPLLTLMPFMMASGRSKNGLWGGTSHHSTGMYKLYADKVENAFFGGTNWSDSGGWGACNGSISPSKEPARQNRLMHLNSYLSLPDGLVLENHKGIVIRSYADPDLSSPIWAMGIPGVRCNNDSSGNLFWDHSEWSTDEEYFTAVGTKVIENWTEGDVYVGRISYAGKNQIRRILKGGGLNHYPHLWIKDGVAPARIRLDRSALEFVTLKKDSAGPPSDTIKVSNAGDGTLPELKTDSLPAWLKVRITGNGTNSPRLIVSVDRTVAGLGDHSATVRISYGQAADSASLAVRLKYSDPVLASLKAERTRLVLRPGDTATLRAVGLDQAGAVLSPQPVLEWKALHALPITAGGLVKADSSFWTPFAFRAAVGSIACTTTVFISRTLIRLDAGASKDSVSEGWTTDGAFAAAWPSQTLGAGPVDLRGQTDPAPARVYRTVRRPAGPILLDSLANGRYSLRFHFSSPFPGDPVPASGMAVKVQGTPLLEDYRLPARPDSGIRGEVREVQATAADGKGLKIEFSGAAGAVSLAGLEINDLGALPISLLHPNGGETAHIGDTLHVRWETDELVTSVGIQVSIDSGKTWIPVTRRSAVNLGQAGWGDYPWVIPDSLDGRSLATGQAILSVYDYFGADRDRSDRTFTILPSLQTGIRPGAGALLLPAAAFSGGRLGIVLPRSGSYRISLTDMRGRLAAEAAGTGPGRIFLPAAALARGVYRLTVSGPGLIWTRSVTLLD